MDKEINGYRLLAPFTTAGAGSARWTFAEKDGGEYFLKEFLSPVYPVDSTPMPDGVRARRRAQCAEYESYKNGIYQAISRADNGNIVAISDFFRHEAKYYIVTRRVEGEPLNAEKTCGLPGDRIRVLARTLIHSLFQLERAGVVHSDLKPTNIMLKPTVNGFFSLKLIDFDGSFFAGRPPQDCEELQGDPVYLSPEMFLAMRGENVKLTSKIDVFATGLIIHEMFTGRLPGYPAEYDYPFEAVLEGAELAFAEALPAEYRRLVADMLRADPDARPGFEEIFSYLTGTPARKTTGNAEKSAAAGRWLRPAGKL